ncbi:alpha/beta fold hydrolase [Pseudonocardia sp. N23]|uniref:alpha/beta fold hydrolase n=1 Tax=Pseudonocardia sp. N23 TaxID=1987376 RepID=UPI000BFBD074|nr:alpha/beta hydrolase [Pseudonocardia sp. N23]
MTTVRTADGTSLHAEETGAGDPLILLPGQGSSHLMWGRTIGLLAARHRVVLFDYRGTGASEMPAAGYSTRGFAGDAVAVLDALGIGRAHVYGFSMGGRVAQWVAVDHPDRVGALVLGATTPGDAHGVPRPEHVNERLGAGGDLTEFLHNPAWARARLRTEGVCNDWRVGTRPVAALRHYRASQAHDSWDGLPSITAPTLCVHGTEDVLNVVANSDLLAGRIPDARVHRIPGAQHGYFEEQEQEAARVVLDFLAEHPITG